MLQLIDILTVNITNEVNKTTDDSLGSTEEMVEERLANPLHSFANFFTVAFGRNRQLRNIWELKSNETDSLNLRFSEGIG
jgi:hypothetical protein